MATRQLSFPTTAGIRFTLSGIRFMRLYLARKKKIEGCLVGLKGDLPLQLVLLAPQLTFIFIPHKTFSHFFTFFLSLFQRGFPSLHKKG